jgi:hypothetical protein
MIFKVTNLRDGRGFRVDRESLEIALVFIESKQKSYGFKSRSKKKIDCDEFELSRIISEETIQENFGIDDQGAEIFQDVVYVNLPDDFIIEDITTQIEAQQNVSNLIKNGIELEQDCKRVLAYIRGYNTQRNLTLPQLQEMRTTFGVINDLLKDGMPQTAKTLISNINPDGVIITEELKQACLQLLAKY